MKRSSPLKMICMALSILLLICALSGCGRDNAPPAQSSSGKGRHMAQTESGTESNKEPEEATGAEAFTAVRRSMRVQDVIHDPVFGDYGRLIFRLNGASVMTSRWKMQAIF